jgi:hypothetical protein
VNDPAWCANTGVSGKVSRFGAGGRSTHRMPDGSDPVGAANRMRDQVIPDQGPPAPYLCWLNNAEPPLRCTAAQNRAPQESANNPLRILQGVRRNLCHDHQ